MAANSKSEAQKKFWSRNLQELADKLEKDETFRVLVNLEADGADAALASSKAEHDTKDQSLDEYIYHMLYKGWLVKQLPQKNEILLSKLENALEGKRKDLCQIIKKWRQQPDFNTSDPDEADIRRPTDENREDFDILTNKRLQELADNLPNHMRKLATYLGFSYEHFNSHVANHKTSGIQTMGMQFLTRWRRGETGKGFANEEKPAKDLYDALNKIDRRDQSSKLKKWIDEARDRTCEAQTNQGRQVHVSHPFDDGGATSSVMAPTGTSYAALSGQRSGQNSMPVTQPTDNINDEMNELDDLQLDENRQNRDFPDAADTQIVPNPKTGLQPGQASGYLVTPPDSGLGAE